VKRLFVHPADALPAALVSGGVVLALVPFVVELPGVVVLALAVLSFAARMVAPVHHHCHAHRRVLRGVRLNRVYDFILMLAAGNLTAVWELQHVVGHHRSHLDPIGDPAAVARFSGEGPWQRILFTIAGDALSFGDALRIAATRPRPRQLVRRLWSQAAVQVLTLGALTACNGGMALLMFLGPNLMLRWMVFYFSFAQHHGTPAHDVYSASVTRFGWSNALFLNVGHHTAHHEQPTLHWTLLPARTAEILHRIPASCVRGER
jgi:beta-carotene hydroxylase